MRNNLVLYIWEVLELTLTMNYFNLVQFEVLDHNLD